MNEDVSPNQLINPVRNLQHNPHIFQQTTIPSQTQHQLILGNRVYICAGVIFIHNLIIIMYGIFNYIYLATDIDALYKFALILCFLEAVLFVVLWRCSLQQNGGIRVKQYNRYRKCMIIDILIASAMAILCTMVVLLALSKLDGIKGFTLLLGMAFCAALIFGLEIPKIILLCMFKHEEEIQYQQPQPLTLRPLSQNTPHR